PASPVPCSRSPSSPSSTPPCCTWSDVTPPPTCPRTRRRLRTSRPWAEAPAGAPAEGRPPGTPLRTTEPEWRTPGTRRPGAAAQPLRGLLVPGVCRRSGQHTAQGLYGVHFTISTGRDLPVGAV